MRRLRTFTASIPVAFMAILAYHRPELCAAQSPAAVANKGVQVQQDVVYGKAADADLTLDLVLPAGDYQKAPAVLFIHGGGWQAGDKKDLLPLAKGLSQHGYVAATINYRHAPQHRFPAQVEDAKCAVRWLRANAERLRIQADKLGAVGASAGGHLAMMLGTMDPADGLEGEGGNAQYSSKVQAVVSYFGPTNLLSDYPPASRAIVKTFIGGSKTERTEDYRRASPITYVNAGDAATLIFQGTKDVLVPYDQATQMATALSDANVPGRVELLLGANHGWGGKEFERTCRDTITFLDQYLKP